MNIELYVNKKFNIQDVIKMVLKRKDWGKTYTLYSTTQHEILIRMDLFNFKNKYATFKLMINEKNDTGYDYLDFDVYIDREDYTLEFVNNLLITKIKRLLNEYREYKASNVAKEDLTYLSRWGKKESELIDILNINDEYTKIKNLDIDEDTKDSLIDTLISNKVDTYNENNYYTVINDRKPTILNDETFYSDIVELIKEIEK